MLVVGLTGSMGMGKSTVGGWFAARGLPVCSSDDVVHALYAGKAVEPIGRLVPDAVVDGQVDRGRLATALQADPSLFPKLEGIVHPLVLDAQRTFLKLCHDLSVQVAVLDIPLLFETDADARVDIVVVVHCPADIQRARVLERPGMTAAKLEAILSRQMPSAQKVSLADFTIDTGVPMAATEAAVDRLVRTLVQRDGSTYQRLWR